MTPTATVIRMSRTAKRPSGGYCLNGSTHIGRCGSRVTVQPSPVFTDLGVASVTLLVRRSILSLMTANLHATWAVWQSSTGAYPAWMFLWFITITWAVKSETPEAGSRLESDVTKPRRISLTETFLTLKPTLSPGSASATDSWCISTDLTSVVRFTGAKATTMPGLRTPVSTRPTGTVPIPPILYTSWSGRRRGLSLGRFGALTPSRVSSRHLPLYQAMLPDFSIMLSPWKPEIGTNGMRSTL
mmetsp:Transcript_105907/g.257298  ORF Transcript_105907/g.257298 Transcript_105907/m.257298 type:complete len:243 (-) Transcript_105907:639-1367(-)